MDEKLTTVIPLTTRHKHSLAVLSDNSYELQADIGDPQFWIIRRVACISGDYPPSEADFSSIQEYVIHLEKQLYD